jgi:hypothetical protein
MDQPTRDMEHREAANPGNYKDNEQDHPNTHFYSSENRQQIIPFWNDHNQADSLGGGQESCRCSSPFAASRSSNEGLVYCRVADQRNPLTTITIQM